MKRFFIIMMFIWIAVFAIDFMTELNIYDEVENLFGIFGIILRYAIIISGWIGVVVVIYHFSKNEETIKDTKL